MQKLLVCVVAAALVVPTVAVADIPGVNLGWSNCSTTSTSENRVFTCDDNGTTFNLVGSMITATDLSDFVGLSATVVFRVNDAAIPAWWQFNTGGCREGSIGTINVGTVGGCVNPYAGGLGQGGGFVIEDIESIPGANDFRVRLDWARAEPFNMVNNTLYTAFILQIASTSSFDEGFGFCAGCATSACVRFNTLEAFGLSGGVIATDAPHVRNWATWQGGLVGADVCPNGTPTKNRTWGQIKALYR